MCASVVVVQLGVIVPFGKIASSSPVRRRALQITAGQLEPLQLEVRFRQLLTAQQTTVSSM